MYNDNDNDNACIMYIDDNNPWVVDSIYNLIEAAVGLEHEWDRFGILVIIRDIWQYL